MIDEILNTCYLAAQASPGIRAIASYSHIIPMILSLALGILVFIKAKFNLFSKVFLAFVVVIAFWLLGDVIAWTSNNYTLVYTTWSILDYLEIVFYVLGLYFALVFVKKSDISTLSKTLLFLLTLPALWLTISNQSVMGFYRPWCEALNNDFLGQYKFAVEGVVLLIILLLTLNPLFRKLSWKIKKTNLIVLGSMFLFLSIFSITEYLASVTEFYEINLYSLFLLPVFLVAIIYSVFELDIFNFHILGTHYLVVGLVVLMGGQLFLITDTTNRLLTILAIILAGIVSIILFRNLKKESDQRVYIAKLNVDLKNLLKERESLVHLVTHKVKGSFTRTKYIFAGMLDGTFGEISPEIKKRAEQGFESDNAGIQTVDLVLNAANLQKGTVKYDMKLVDFKEMVLKTINDKKISVEAKGLQLETEVKEGNYNIMADSFWLKEAVNNLIENSIKYTQAGKIVVNLEDGNGKIKLSVKDTGVGISDEDKIGLFTEGGRGKDSIKINVDSTGYGLYTVRLVVEAHGGKVWAESEGPGKGAQFYMELNAVDAQAVK